MDKKENKQEDLRNKSPEELIEYYSKISEDILVLNSLLEKNQNPDSAVKIYQRTKKD